MRHLHDSKFHRGFQRLLQSHDYSQELGCSVWDFAVELSDLTSLGLSRNDVRWLLGRGLIEQGTEVVPSKGCRRSFERKQDWTFGERTCFVLTSIGVAQVMALLDSTVDSLPSAEADAQRLTPKWDPCRRTLYFLENVVKQFRVPAPNQELILTVFEEEDWPYRVDDPLPCVDSIFPKRRLHDTINALNRKHQTTVLRFFGDGRGEGICWEPAS